MSDYSSTFFNLFVNLIINNSDNPKKIQLNRSENVQSAEDTRIYRLFWLYS